MKNKFRNKNKNRNKRQCSFVGYKLFLNLETGLSKLSFLIEKEFLSLILNSDFKSKSNIPKY